MLRKLNLIVELAGVSQAESDIALEADLRNELIQEFDWLLGYRDNIVQDPDFPVHVSEVVIYPVNGEDGEDDDQPDDYEFEVTVYGKVIDISEETPPININRLEEEFTERVYNADLPGVEDIIVTLQEQA